MKALIICLIFAICLIGCGPSSPSLAGVGYPNDQAIQIQESPFPSIIPTPVASKGTVIGTLVSNPPGTSLAGLALYFGTLLPLTPGPDHLVTMDPVKSPKATVHNDGRFLVENITPGDYVLILWTPHESRYIPDPNNSKDNFIVKVVGGQILDVGTLQASPP